MLMSGPDWCSQLIRWLDKLEVFMLGCVQDRCRWMGICTLVVHPVYTPPQRGFISSTTSVYRPADGFSITALTMIASWLLTMQPLMLYDTIK